MPAVFALSLSLTMSLAAQLLDFVSAPVNPVSFFIIIIMFNLQTQMFNITVLVLE
jgi:hypothetical protein